MLDCEIHEDYWGSDHCPISCTFDMSQIDLAAFKAHQLQDKNEQTSSEKEDIDSEASKVQEIIGDQDLDDN